MQLLADADFLIALVKEDDQNHTSAIRTLQNLKSALIFITPFTLPEAATVLSYKVSHATAKTFLREAREKFVELPLNDDITHSADEIFESQEKKRTSWIDCLNAAMVKYYQLDGILSYDKFYTSLKIKML